MQKEGTSDGSNYKLSKKAIDSPCFCFTVLLLLY